MKMSSKIATISLTAIILQSLLVLSGWYFGNSLLTSYSSEYIPMAPSTAIGFLSISVCFALLSGTKPGTKSKYAGGFLLALIFLFSLNALAHYLFNTSFNLENRLFPNYGNFKTFPKGRMSPFTGALFLISALSFLAPASKNLKRYLVDGLNMTLFLASFSILLSYLIEKPLLYELRAIPVALPTGISFFLLSVFLINKSASTAGGGQAAPQNERFNIVFILPILLITTLCVFVMNLETTEKRLFEAESHKYDSMILSEELRKSSEDLTKYARAYVATGDKSYKEAYTNILNVRNGVKPRPHNMKVAPGKKIPLRNLMRNQGFTREELNELATAENNSNKLVATEMAAINAMSGMNSGGDGPYRGNEDPQRYAIRIMHDKKYHSDKAAIMNPIERFDTLIHKRIEKQVRREFGRIQYYIHLIIVNIALLIITLGAVIYIYRKSKKSLRHSEEKYRSLFVNNRDAVMTLGPPGWKFTSSNPATLEMFNTSSEEAFTKLGPWDLSPENQPDGRESREKALEMIRAAMRDGATYFNWTHKRLGGEEFPATVSLSRMTLGGHAFLQATVRDISDIAAEEQNKQRLHEQEKHAVIGKVTGKMAHDFNNLLGIIVGTSELLLTENLPPEITADIEIIKDSAFKGRDLTKNLLLFAKDQEPKLSQFNLCDKIDTAIKSLRPDLRGVNVVVNHGPGVENILADAGLFENAMINMIQNSIHAMGKTQNPRLQIRTYQEGANAVVEIQDNGCGVPESCKDKIYEPTFTLKGSADRSAAYLKDVKGSGYGMANVKRFVDSHGGSITLESEEKKGARFKISLPLITGNFDAAQIETIQSQGRVENKKILIVEDEPQLGRILYSSLGKFNHRTDLATDGKMALDHINNNEYDAISLDFVLPDINGLEIYRAIREKNKDIPIIFVSGNFEFMQSMIDLKKEDTRVDHIAKPFNSLEYVNKIHSWLL